MLRNVLLTYKYTITAIFYLSAAIYTSSSLSAETSSSNNIHYASILQYHHVNTSTPAVTSISPEQFEAHLELIQSEGFQVISLELVIDMIKLGAPFHKKTIAITFDDNYASIYHNAFPLLKSRKWPFTIFVNPKSISKSESASDSNFILSWNQLKEMKSHGAIISNHTNNHWHLLKQNPDESPTQWKNRIKQDIQSAQSMLEKKLGKTPKWVAYPYGEFDNKLKKLISDMGYLGFSQQSGGVNHTTNWQSIPRFPASGIYANAATLNTKINSEPFEIYSERPENKIRLAGESAPSIEIIVNSNNVRHKQLTCYFSGKKIYSESLVRGNKLIINAQLEGPLPFGRSRYNCTAPSTKGHYFWYSMPFVSTNEQLQWQD